MFELMRAYETAKNEKNKLLRFIYIQYIKYKLKSDFFKKFNIRYMEINHNLLNEFMQFYNCVNEDDMKNRVSKLYPYIRNVTKNGIHLVYCNYFIDVYILNEKNYNIEIQYGADKDATNRGKTIQIHPTNNYLNISFLREIILTAIYNYCVSYIYGINSELYIPNSVHRQKLYDMYYYI